MFLSPAFHNHEQVIFCYDPVVDVKAIIAIHSTKLGPALGGCRMWHYATENEAVEDVLRLSEGMTYKAAISNVDTGGGKMVVLWDENRPKTPEIFRAIGRFVESLNGRYITAEDVGTTVHDMEYVLAETPHVVGIHGGNGDPSPFTAYGVFVGIKTATFYGLNVNSLSGIRVLIQGTGAVGARVARLLAEEGADVFVSDINTQKAQVLASDIGGHAIAPEEVYTFDGDVYVPCALGGTLNDITIPLMKYKVIAGAANNQLRSEQDGALLQAHNILYAPDYVINAGGLINVFYERQKAPLDTIYAHINKIEETLMHIFSYASSKSISTSEAANHLAESKFLAR